MVKEKVCQALGYPVPLSFKKTRPRFPCQNLDIFTQKSNNIQIWNEEIDANRRYAIIRVDATGSVSNVKVVNGTVLSSLDKTGTLTQKYQAILPVNSESCLFSKFDTDNLSKWLLTDKYSVSGLPTDDPLKGRILPIAEIYERISKLVGLTISEISKDQERNRGSVIHKEVCKALGYEQYLDNGQFPDIPNQLIEIKLQTSQTIDLGKHAPNDHKEVLPGILSNDVRYAIFYGTARDGLVTIEKIFMVNGEKFFELNKPIQGISKKIQLPIPSNFFD